MPTYEKSSPFYGMTDSERAKKQAEDAAFARTRAQALENHNVNVVNEGPAAAALRAQQQQQNEIDDASRPLKGALPPFQPPAPGTAAWAALPQPALQNQSPAEVSRAWGAANYAAMSDEARLQIGRDWGRQISPAEVAATPTIDSATRKYWDDPGVRQRAAARADAAVPAAPALRRQVPANSPYGVG